jgi:hypothetical protein
VFLSYANADRVRVEPLVTALEREGLDVWWDREIPRGQNFNRVIEAALGQARCAIVVWSHASVTSEWVFNEASEARKRQMLVPVLIDDVDPPLEFRHLQAARLVGWSGDRSDTEWSGLLSGVRTLVDRPGAAHVAASSTSVSASYAPSADVSRHWWQTPAGAAAGVGALLVGAALLLIVANQIGLFGGGSAPAESAATAVLPPGEPSVSPLGAPSNPTSESTLPVQTTAADAAPAVTAAGSSDRVNLLDPAQGGKLVIASQDSWKYVVGTAPFMTTVSTGGFAVFAFRDEKPVVIDGIGVFVESTSNWNVKELAVSASDRSETGPFRTIGVVTVPNYRNMRGPVHEFPVQPFSARYVKVEVVAWQGQDIGSSGYVGNLRLLGLFQ